MKRELGARLDGSRYLLKRPCKIRARVPDEGIGLALLGLALEERGDCLERIAFNDQPFLLRAGFTLLTLGFWLLTHVIVVLSYRFLSGTKIVPQPGIEPERLEWARGCKPRLSASSSTGGYSKAPNAGAVTPVKTSTVPAWFFRPFSAALNLSSLVLLPLSAFSLSERAKNVHDSSEQINLFESEVQRKLNKGIRQPRYGHSIKALWSSVHFARVLLEAYRLAIFFRLFYGGSWCAWLRVCDMRRQSSPAFRQRLQVKTDCFRQHLTLGNPVGLECFLKFGHRPAIKVYIPNDRGVLLRNNFKQSLLKFGLVLPRLHELPINVRRAPLLIDITEKAKPGHQRSVIGPRKLVEYATVERATGDRNFGKSFSRSFEHAKRHVRRRFGFISIWHSVSPLYGGQLYAIGEYYETK